MGPSALLVSLLLSAPPSLWLGPKPVEPASVTRVVSAAPSVTEMLVEMGAESMVVGVSRFDETDIAKLLPKVAGFNDVSIEKVLGLKPQLVLVSMAPGNKQAIEQLAKMGIAVLALRLDSVDDVLSAMRVVGAAVNRAAEGDLLAFRLETARNNARARASARKVKPTVLLAFGLHPLVVAGPGSFAHELLQDCGAVNVAQVATTAYPTFAVEKAIALSPDVLIDASDDDTGRERMRALLPSKLKWIRLPSKSLMHPGPSLVTALHEMENALEPLSLKVGQ
jgi:iron complex transport system substrate-binding protein